MITTLQARTRYVVRQQQQQRISIVVAGSVVDATAQLATPTEIILRPESWYRRLWYPSLQRAPSVATPSSSSRPCHKLWQRQSSWKTLTGIPVSASRLAAREEATRSASNSLGWWRAASKVSRAVDYWHDWTAYRNGGGGARMTRVTSIELIILRQRAETNNFFFFGFCEK